MDKVSVIITTYNNEKYIDQCVRSVMKQSYQNLEIIIINDGSTDRTLELCEHLRQGDPRIRLLSEENLGVSHARNRGIELATGDYLMFVDGDDFISSQLIEKLVDRRKSDQSDIVVSNPYRIDEEGKYYFLVNRDDPRQQAYDHCYTPQEWLEMDGIVYVFNMVWAKIFRRSLFDNIRFPKGRYAEDSMVAWKLYLTANTISYTLIDEYCYRVTNGSLTEDPNKKALIDKGNVMAIQERAQFYPLLGISLAQIRRDYFDYNDDLIKVNRMAKTRSLPLLNNDFTSFRRAIRTKYQVQHGKNFNYCIDL